MHSTTLDITEHTSKDIESAYPHKYNLNQAAIKSAFCMCKGSENFVIIFLSNALSF